MKKEKIKSLEKHGWKTGTVSDFLHLSREEEEYIEMKIALARYFQELRKKKHLTQTQVADIIKSSQSRVAKIESAESSVSIDLMVRSIFALGSTNKQLAKVMQANSNEAYGTAETTEEYRVRQRTKKLYGKTLRKELPR